MKNGIKSVTVLTVICVAVSLLVALTNSFTAPVIEENKQSASTESLKQVLENAADFQLLEKPADAPVTVQEIYKETGGLGYAVTVAVTTSYSASPMLYTVGISSDGVITGIVITNYSESKDFGKDTYPQSYVGMDSALNGAELVSGVTYSSTAFKKGIEDVFAALIDMGLIGAGEKSEEQKIEELLNTLLAGSLSDSGRAVLAEYETNADWVKAGYAATNGTGYALVAEDNTVYVINPFGHVKAYNIDGQDMTESASRLNDAAGAVPNNAKETAEKDKNALARIAGEGAVFTQITDLRSFSTVTNLFRIEEGEEVYYGFVSHPIGYNNGSMTVYGILDKNGAVKEVKVSEIILYSQYYDDYTLDESAYYEGLAGKTQSTLTDEDTLINGATISGNGVNKALKDMFIAFEEITKGGEG